MAKNQEDLPAMEGDGVAPKKIKALEVAADEYVEIRDKRMAMTEKEVAARNKVVDLMNKHEVTTYCYGDHKIVLEHGADKIKVRAIAADGEGDEEGVD